MAQEKSPLRSTSVLPTTSLWLPTLKDKAFSPERGVLYIEKTLLGNFKCFYLDESGQRISLQVLAKSIAKNSRLKDLLNAVQKAAAGEAEVLSPEDSAELIRLVNNLKRPPIGLKFYSEGEVSIIKRTERGQIPAHVSKRLGPDDDSEDKSYLERKVFTTEIKFESVKKDNENNSNFWSYIQKNLKYIRPKHGKGRLAALSGELSNEYSNIKIIEEKIGGKSKELKVALMEYSQGLDLIEMQQGSTDYSALLANKENFDKMHKELTDLIDSKEFYLSAAVRLEKKIRELDSSVDNKKIILFLDKIDSLFESRPYIMNALNRDICADSFDFETLFELRMLLKKLHLIYADLRAELYSPDYNLIPCLETDSYSLNEKIAENRDAIKNKIIMLKPDMSVEQRREVYNKIVADRNYFLEFLVNAYTEKYKDKSVFKKLQSYYQENMISIGEFAFLCQQLEENPEFVGKTLDAAKNSAVTNTTDEKTLGDELLSFMRFETITEEIYFFARAQSARSHSFICIFIKNFHYEDKKGFDLFLRDCVNLFNGGYITIEDAEKCVKNQAEKSRLMRAAVKEAKMKKALEEEFSHPEVNISEDNLLIKIKITILKKININFGLSIKPADVFTGINPAQEPQFSFPDFFSFTKPPSSFQKKAFSFLQEIFKEKNFEEVKAILKNAVQDNPEDSTFFNALILQISSLQEAVTVSLEPGETKLGPSAMVRHH